MNRPNPDDLTAQSAQPQKLTYIGLGVVRPFNKHLDAVPTPGLFDTPKGKWVYAELWWTTGFEPLIFDSVETAERTAEKMGIPFVCKMRRKRA